MTHGMLWEETGGDNLVLFYIIFNIILMTITLSQDYRMVQAAHHKQPYLDYPYIGIPDEDTEDLIEKLYP